MLNFIYCLGVLGAILAIEEFSYRRKTFHGEYQRKITHIGVATFAAFWPWLLSWRQIQVLAFAILVFALANHYLKIFHYEGTVTRKTNGNIYFPIAILACSLITTQPVFFAIAMLHLGLADGFAAVVGTKFGNRYKYKIFGQTKTAIGTMTFWFISALILGIALPFANQQIDFHQYFLLILFLPPILSVIENVSLYGSDNISVPLAVLFTLQNI